MILRDERLVVYIQRLKQQTPAIYRRYFSRIYSGDDRFSDWRFPLFMKANSEVEFTEVFQTGRPLSTFHEIVFQEAALGAPNNFPLFFVEPDFFYSALASGVPSGLHVRELKLPFPSFTFVLPNGAFPTPDGEVRYITVTDDKESRDFAYAGAKIIGHKPVDEGVILSTTFSNTATIYHYRVNDEEFLEGRPPSFDVAFAPDDPPPPGSMFAKDPKAVHKFQQKMADIAATLLLAMECRPDIVTRERKIKHFRRDNTKEIWEPNKVGYGFRLKYEDNSEPGSHSSPRAHPRRGHFRLVPCGPRICQCKHARNIHDEFCMHAGCPCQRYVSTQDRQKQWIEPVWVNLKKVA